MISLPTMLRLGYNKELAVGSICASGVLGILIPPSIMLVIIGDLLQISVGDLFMGAVLPGLLLSTLYCLYIVILCALRPELAPARTDIERLPPIDVLILVARSLAPPLTLILVVLGSIFFGWATPTEAAGVGAFGAVLLALVHNGFRGLELDDVVVRSARTVGMIFAVILGATAFSYVFRSLGGDALVEDFLRGLPFGPWFILFVIMLVIFLLGFVIEWLEIVLIVLPLVFPIIRSMDFGTHVVGADVHIWFAILVAVNLQTSFLTPPFGFALFYVKGMAPPSVTLMHIYRGIIPFVILQLLGLAITMAVPALATWLPKLAYS
jgi:tripartite ATP-independent transporter DctM subunit